MDRSTEDQTALAIVRLGYALDDPTDSRRCLNFRVGFNDQESAYEALGQIDQYNDFNGPAVAAALRESLRASATVEVGREGSPVVYIEWFLSADEGYTRAAMDALHAAHADEVNFDNHRVRGWWD